MRKFIRKVRYWARTEDNVSEKEIVKYLEKNFTNYIWQWTTVDEYGYPQIMLYLFSPKTKKYKGWKLIKQIEIKNK